MTAITLGGGIAQALPGVGAGPLTAYVTGTMPGDKVTYRTGTIEIYNADDLLVYSHNPKFRGRGNTTGGLPKKPYKVRSQDRRQRPLNYPASRDWALMADYNDQSYLRTTVAFHLAHQATGRWAARSRHMRLVWNDSPQGLYRYSETVDVQRGRVDIREMDEGDIEGNSLTGPYFVETSHEFDNPGFLTANETPVMYDTPDGAVPQQAAYIEAWTNTLESALLASDESAILALIDLQSWVDWYLLFEFTANTEGRWFKSCKWMKDQDSPNGSGKMVLWPPWDFDLSLGINADSPTPHSPQGWLIQNGPNPYHPNWLALIWSKSSTFRAACAATWTENYLPALATLGAFIDTTHAEIAPFIAEDRALWFEGATVADLHTTAWVKDWMNDRAAWITANL